MDEHSDTIFSSPGLSATIKILHVPKNGLSIIESLVTNYLKEKNKISSPEGDFTITYCF